MFQRKPHTSCTTSVRWVDRTTRNPLLLVSFRPTETVYALVGLGTAGIINLAIVVERAEAAFAVLFDPKHDFFCCIPRIHQDRPECQVFLIHTVPQHVQDVIRLRLSVDNADAFDDTMGIPTVLPPYECDMVRNVSGCSASLVSVSFV